jgi:hypothetical protein
MSNMMLNLLLAFTLLLTLAACAQIAQPAGPVLVTTTPPAGKEVPSPTPPVVNPKPTGTPESPDTTFQAYPLPGTPVVEGPLSGFIEGASLGMSKNAPARPVLNIAGDLPTPCHKLAFKVAQPDKDNQVYVSLAITPPSPGVNCIQVLSHAEQEIPLGNLIPGTYTVLLNGVKVGTISVP